MEQEIWKSVKGFEGSYEVSTFGRIRSLERSEPFCNRWGKTILRKRNAKTLKLSAGRGGYLLVSLSNITDGKRSKSYRVHRLVAEAFIANPNNKPQINHKDTNKTNNHFSNLEWCSYQENEAHANRYKLHPSKEAHGKSKLTQLQVNEIREKYTPKTYSLTMLAKEYGVGRSTIRHIINNDTWT